MKKIFVLFSMCALMMVGTSAFAQEGQHKCQHDGKECTHQCHQPKVLTPNTISMLKEEFFKENLKLNDNQKDAFWKAYNKYENAKKQAKENAKAAMKKAGLPEGHCPKSMDHGKLTADQKVALHNIQLESRQAMLKAEQTFYQELAKSLTNEQIVEYMGLEKAFQMEMAKMMGGDKCGNHGGCQGHGEGGHDGHHACKSHPDNHKCDKSQCDKMNESKMPNAPIQK